MSNFFQNQDKNLCCGCGACEQICPQNAIEMKEDEEGFFYPVINKKLCTNCALCIKVCPIKDGGYLNKSALNPPGAYAAHHKNEQILKNSTSGGAFTAIAQAFCDKDYVIFGASFDENLVVRHKFITDIKNIYKLRGSKYVQSSTEGVFSEVRKFLEKGKKVLFSGTPCQAAGLKSFLGKDYENLLTIEILCHGVPSPFIFKKYKEYLTEKYKKNIIDLNFRDKNKRGWIKPYVMVQFEDGQVVKDVHADNPFIIGFYRHYYIRPVCHSCSFTRIPRVADITLCDFWGVEEIDPSFYNKDGNSLILVNTDKGKNIFNISRKYLLTAKEDIKEAKKFNPRLYRSATVNQGRNQFLKDAQHMKFERLKERYLTPRSLPRRTISLILSPKIKRRIKKYLNYQRNKGDKNGS